MKLDYILIKNLLILILAVFALYQLFIMIFSISAQPKNIEIAFKPINQLNFQSSAPSENIQVIVESDNFDYEVVGYRAGNSRSSVIVKKDNKSFVVQQGELLENRYKLISVNANFANFEYLGNKYQLKTNLLNEE